jgi:sec-independent protein translocase protein TatA
MSFGIWQILIVVLLVVVLFGRGKISSLMGDMAQGIKAFKKGMKDDEDIKQDLKAPYVITERSSEPSNKTESEQATQQDKV